METITRLKFTSASRIDRSRNVDVFTLAMVMSFPVGEGSLVKAKCWENFIFMKLSSHLCINNKLCARAWWHLADKFSTVVHFTAYQGSKAGGKHQLIDTVLPTVTVLQVKLYFCQAQIKETFLILTSFLNKVH